MKITIALICLLLLGLLFFWIWTSRSSSKNLAITDLIKLPQPSTKVPDVLGDSQKIVDDTIQDTKQVLGQSIIQSGESISSYIQGQAQNLANNVTPSNSTTVIVSPSIPPNTSSQNIFNLDYNSATFNIKFFRNTMYYLNFSNLPGNSCLLIDGSSYPISSDQTVALIFASSSSRGVSVNSCPIAPKSLVTIEVE